MLRKRIRFISHPTSCYMNSKYSVVQLCQTVSFLKVSNTHGSIAEVTRLAGHSAVTIWTVQDVSKECNAVTFRVDSPTRRATPRDLNLQH
jgi:hypothetical protein